MRSVSLLSKLFSHPQSLPLSVPGDSQSTIDTDQLHLSQLIGVAGTPPNGVRSWFNAERESYSATESDSE